MFSRPGLAGPLFRLDNFCSPDVVEEKLYEKGRYNDLIDFLYGKRLHKEALGLMQKFGKRRASDDNSDIDYSSLDDSLKGPQRTIAYLQQLPFELVDLILKYAAWPVRVQPEAGMQIFIADSDNAEGLPRDRVLAFLEDLNSQLAVQYLEHIIEEWHDRTSEFHERLVELYIDRLQSRSVPADIKTSMQTKLEVFLQTSSEYSLTSILKELPSNSATYYISRTIVLSKLERHRDALEILVFEMSSPFEAELYCLRTFSASESSVVETLEIDDTDTPSPSQSSFTVLLSLYLNPPVGQTHNTDAALDLLSRHGARLPALSALQMLPHSLPIKRLDRYFEQRMRASNARARELKIATALASVRAVDAEALLLLGPDSLSDTTQPEQTHGHDAMIGFDISTGKFEESDRDEKRSIRRSDTSGRQSMATRKGRNARVKVAENTLCRVCGKRFGRQAMRVWPDGTVMHLACSS